MSDVFEIPPLKFERSPSAAEFGPMPFLDLREVSGGNSSAIAAKAAAQIEEFATEGGGLLFKPYGEHVIGAAALILHIFTPGSPNTSVIFVALGDGQGYGGSNGLGGNRGRWDSAVTVWYAGEALSVSPNGTTPGYRFVAGFISTAVDSGPQPVDPFHAVGLAYSGTAIVAAFLNNAAQTAQDRPDKLRVRAKCRWTLDFDATGRRTGESYSTNPARVAADQVLTYWERKFPNDPALAFRKFQESIDWEAWVAWRDYCDGLISWFNGIETVNIKRFECHVVFTEDTNLADALDQICATCASTWQLDGGTIIFLPFNEREPVHHFDESNIIAMSDVEPRDLRVRPNYLILKFRDLDDSTMGQATVEVRRESLRRQAGEVKTERAMPPMNRSQAARLAEFQMRMESDNPDIFQLVGDEKSLRALPGDYVTITHPLLKSWGAYQRCLVHAATLLSAEEAPDHTQFVLQRIIGPLISDTAHGPRQEKAQSLAATAVQSPDAGQAGTLAVTGITTTGHPVNTITFAPGPGVEGRSARWSAFPAAGGTMVSVKLKFEWTENGSVAGGGSNNFQVEYSTNNGGAWTQIFQHNNVTAADSDTAEVALSTSQNLTQVQVRHQFSATAITGFDSASISASMANIRIEVELD